MALTGVALHVFLRQGTCIVCVWQGSCTKCMCEGEGGCIVCLYREGGCLVCMCKKEEALLHKCVRGRRAGGMHQLFV